MTIKQEGTKLPDLISTPGWDLIMGGVGEYGKPETDEILLDCFKDVAVPPPVLPVELQSESKPQEKKKDS